MKKNTRLAASSQKGTCLPPFQHTQTFRGCFSQFVILLSYRAQEAQNLGRHQSALRGRSTWLDHKAQRNVSRGGSAPQKLLDAPRNKYLPQLVVSLHIFEKSTSHFADTYHFTSNKKFCHSIKFPISPAIRLAHFCLPLPVI
jgi:hypothetical protein